MSSPTGTTETITTPELVVEPVAYNKASLLATTLDGHGNPVDPSASHYRGSPPGAAREIVDDARTKLGPTGSQGMKHTVAQTTAQAQALTEANVKTTLESMTVFVAGTHGDTDGFNDALTKGQAANPGYLLVSEILTAIDARGVSIPKPNLVLMYSCQTLTGPTDDTKQIAFRVNDTDKAYVGFAGPVASKLKKGSTAVLSEVGLTDYLDDHSKIVMSELAAGKRLSLAINEANTVAPPRTINPVDEATTIPIDALIIGDSKTRLVFVYLTLSEMSAIQSAGGSIDTWFYIS